ncbi:SOS response-associated peptidase family protein [Terrihabitans rhizophilus]|uniref:SOS response-associated peptidase family protein n=1 Tax=Terrihabitans rhizophilus TaxID=3092662 RepID=UPI003CC63FB7
MRTFTIITTRGNETIYDLHQRMPVILKPDTYEQVAGSGCRCARSAAPLPGWRDGALDV